MTFTNEQMAKAKTAKSAEELLAIAKESGISMTEDEAAKYFAELHKEGELNDDELGTVAGGSKGSEPQEYDVRADWAPSCDGQYQKIAGLTFSSLRDGDMCGKCIYFKYSGSLNKETWGKCRREFDS